MRERIYVAAVERTIRDEIEVEIRVVGEMTPLELERKVEEMAGKLTAFDPAMLNTSIKARLKFLDLIEETESTSKIGL